MSLQTVRTVFMGTPDFAVPSLRLLLQHTHVVGVVTQPDRPAGRGQRFIESPVKQVARAAGALIIQPHRLREPDALTQLRAWQPDLIVVAAFGQILKPAVLDLPPHGCLNVHASLLPRWRGAAPIAAAIAAGDAETGITLIRMDVGLDIGPMLAQSVEAIRPDDTTASLTERLAGRGADLLLEKLPAYLAGELTPQTQDSALATYAPQLKKEDGHLDFTRSAAELERRVRALTPWPGAFAYWQGQPLKVLRAAVRAAVADTVSGQPGEVLALADGVAVACAEGTLRLLEIQPAGKRAMPAADFARGARNFVGSRLS